VLHAQSGGEGGGDCADLQVEKHSAFSQSELRAIPTICKGAEKHALN
jgi:hypothetical protein